MKLSIKKCFFLGQRGSTMQVTSFHPSASKQTPKRVPNAKEGRRFLAFTGYCRKFVKDFSKIARMLSDLMPYTSPVKKGKKKMPQKEWNLESKHEEAFCQLKQLLTSSPILTYPVYDKPVELHSGCSTLSRT